MFWAQCLLDPPAKLPENMVLLSSRSRENAHGKTQEIPTGFLKIHTDTHGYTRHNTHGKKIIHTGKIHTDTHGDSHTSAAKCSRAIKIHTDTHGDTHGDA